MAWSRGSNDGVVIVTTPFLGECAFFSFFFLLFFSFFSTSDNGRICSDTIANERNFLSYREIILYRDGAVTAIYTRRSRFDRDSRTFILLEKMPLGSIARHATPCRARFPWPASLRLASIAFFLRSTAIYRHDLTRHELMPTSCFARL